MTDENLSKQVCKIFSQPLPYDNVLGFGGKMRRFNLPPFFTALLIAS